MKFNLINPSDPYTFEADDLEIAAAVTILLGEGAYPADAMGEHANTGNNVPAFMFGRAPDPWFREKFGRTFQESMDHCVEQRTEALARAFDSVTLGRERRSSLNDIGGRARDYAAGLRERVAAGGK